MKIKNRTKRFISCLLLLTMVFNVLICPPIIYGATDNEAALSQGNDALQTAKDEVYNADTGGNSRARNAINQAKTEISAGERDLNGTSAGGEGDTSSLSKLASFAAAAQKVILKIGEVLTKIGEILKKVAKILKTVGKVLKVLAKIPYCGWLEPIGEALIRIGEKLHQIGCVILNIGKAVTAVGQLTSLKDANFGDIVKSIKDAVVTGWTQGKEEYANIDTSAWEEKAEGWVEKGTGVVEKIGNFFQGKGNDDGM